MLRTSDIPYTPVSFEKRSVLLSERSPMGMIGSCFAASAGEALLESGFPIRINPCGITYNPVSLHNAMTHVVRDIPYSEDALFSWNGQWHSWDHHGCFSNTDRAQALAKMELARTGFRSFLATAEALLVTHSSAVVFQHNTTGNVVANCHKVPSGEFTRRLLTRMEVESAMRDTLTLLHEFNPQCRLIVTLSPVRHYPGDLLLNARSKAILLSAIHDTLESDGNENDCYFPAFELVNDELRDYRFFADDMLHPSPLAAQIVLKRFLETCFCDSALRHFNTEQKRLRQSRHIPFGGD